MAIEVSRATRATGGPGRSRVIGPGGPALWLSGMIVTGSRDQGP